MGHSYGLLTAWDIPIVYYFMGHSYELLNFMGHGLLTAWGIYGSLTSWDIPMVY